MEHIKKSHITPLVLLFALVDSTITELAKQHPVTGDIKPECYNTILNCVKARG
jgi:hypothetical protein